MNHFANGLPRRLADATRVSLASAMSHTSNNLAQPFYSKRFGCNNNSRHILSREFLWQSLSLSQHARRRIASIQIRSASTQQRGSKSKKDDNAPLLNEHLIAELLKNRPGSSANSYEVRLVLDTGRNSNKNKKENESEHDDEQTNTEEAPMPTTQIVTIDKAISIAHDHSLDLMEVTLKGDPPVIKALDFEKFLYQQKKKESKSKSKQGGGAISDKPLKEFKFRAGIAEHDLLRKAKNMIGYLEKGHAVRVTLTARMKMLREDTQAIKTTLDRVKELVGDKGVEVKALQANERGSYGNLLMHPNLKK